MGSLTRLIHTLAICATIHNIVDKSTVILDNSFIVVVVSHIQRNCRQPGKTTLHSGQSRSSWSVEHGHIYRSVYAIPVAYSFLHVPGISRFWPMPFFFSGWCFSTLWPRAGFLTLACVRFQSINTKIAATDSKSHQHPFLSSPTQSAKNER